MFRLTFLCLIWCIATTGHADVCPKGRTKREFRGAWIATVSNIDWPKSSGLSTDQNKKDLLSLINSLKFGGFNAVILQVRPAGDAFYRSAIEPWSKWLTGHQGQAPSPMWDPLQFVIDECHKRGMDVHAWFNPYRADTGSNTTNGLAPSNMAMAFPDVAYPYDRFVWMDPGSQQVQDRTHDVIMDVVKRYDVDGIHFDDYFYPYPTTQEFPDQKTYQDYKDKGGQLSLADWRRQNVNQLISRLSKSIHDTKPGVKFGISPFGIWKAGHPTGVVGSSGYDILYADCRLWLQKGWVDYLAPQIYWEIESTGQSFTALVDWWSDPIQNPLGRHIYPGLADYKLSRKNWDASEIVNQVNVSRGRYNLNVLGNIHFSAKYIQDNTKGLKTQLLNSVYKKLAIKPKMDWIFNGAQTSLTPPKVTTYQPYGALIWSDSDASSVEFWAVYHVTTQGCDLVGFYHKNITGTYLPAGAYLVSAIDHYGNEMDGNVDVIDNTIIG